MEAAEDERPRKRDAASLAGSPASRPPKRPRNSAVAIGALVRKSFPADVPPRVLLGKVLSCCGRQYTIAFEDGRREALNLPETRQILLPEEEAASADLCERMGRLEDLCRSAPASAPRTRSRRNAPEPEPKAPEPEPKAPSDAAGKDEVEVLAPAEMLPDPLRLGSSSSTPSSNLDDDGDSFSDSCDSARPGDAEALPPVVPLPPSSGDINVPEDAISFLFNVYSFLRSFSHQLFLSPFGFDDFVGALNCTVSNSLLDAVHVSLLRALRRHLEVLEADGSKLACTCLKCLDWNLLDIITWPVFLVWYFSVVGHIKQLDREGFLAGALEGEYYGLPAAIKLSVLQILCDDVLESAELATELGTRENMDEEKDIDINPDVTFVEGGPRRVHPRYAKTSACKNPGSLEETITAVELVSSSKSTENDPKDSNVGQDGNSDDCRLCGMEGTLVCCDGCPSAYHSRCISLNKASLPDGPWFCPECMVKKMGSTSSRVSFGIRGAELFGSDPFGRIFLGSCDYLLVLEHSFEGKHISRYYNRNDITEVLRVLCSTLEISSLYAGIFKSISIHWEIVLSMGHLQPFKNEDVNLIVVKDATLCSRSNHVCLRKREVDDQTGELTTFNEEDGDLPLLDNRSVDASVLVNAESLGTESIFNGSSSERKLEDLESKVLCVHQKTFEQIIIPSHNGYQPGDELSKSAGESNLLSNVNAERQGNVLKNSSAIFKPHQYINQYIPGEVAASAAANFAIAAAERNKTLETNTSSKDRKNLPPMAALQLKSFSEASMHFLWPGNDKKLFDVLRERCGWCLACESAVTCKKGCLLNVANMYSIKGCSRSLGNFRPFEYGSHRSSIAAYILYMEASLSGLLEGPFLDAYHNVQWRKAVAEVSTIRLFKSLLLEFENSIRGIAFSAEWLKPVDERLSEMPNSQNGSCIPVSSQKRSLRGRRGRKRSSLSEYSHSDCDADRGRIQWWYGGKLLNAVLRRAALPAALVKRSARQGGRRELSGILYNLKMPSTTREVTWRAAVERCRNYSQLAFLVRYLDTHLRWRDLYRPESALDGKVVDIESSVFRSANITSEKVSGKYTTYALTFGDQKHLPLRITRNVLETEQSIDGDRLWFSENFVPLYLIKEYEEKKNKSASCMPTLTKEASWQSIIPRIKHSSAKENIFSYLFHSGENPVKASCSSCKKDVLLRHALLCQNCEGPCHRNCLKVSTIDMKTCTCTVCYNVNPLKKDVPVNLKIRISTSNCRILSQSDLLTPERKTLGQSSLDSSKNSSKINKRSEKKPDSSNTNSRRKNLCPNNGLIFKKKKNGVDTESQKIDPEFRTKNLILKGDVEMGTYMSPICKLCQLPYSPNFMYIRCESCSFWYHADSVQLVEHKIVELVGFRCPACRRRCSPTCPYADRNLKRTSMKRKGMGKKECHPTRVSLRTSKVSSQTPTEPSESLHPMQSAQIKVEDTVALLEQAEQTSTSMSDTPDKWSVSGATLSSKGKLPVRRHAGDEIPTNVVVKTEFSEEPGALFTVRSDLKQEVDIQDFSSIPEVDFAVGADEMYFNSESDFATADGNLDVGELGGNYQMFDSNNVDTGDLEYEPQTYFSFTELLASGDEQGGILDMDISVDVPDDWHPPGNWDSNDASSLGDNSVDQSVLIPGYFEQVQAQTYDGPECSKCSSNCPPPNLCCGVCGLTIHSHCSPWVENEQVDDSRQWRCGNCREWR